MLEVKDLTVKVQDKIILDKFNLKINLNEIHTIMGVNGAGKSTICKVIMGDPNYEVVCGTITFNNENLLKLDTTSRARLGIYLVSQSPIEIEGVTTSEMLRTALGEKNGKQVDIFEFNKKIMNACEILKLDKSFIHRGINEGMSGGERKKCELLHLFILEPTFIILDELDSGLDIDSLKIVSKALNKYLETHDASLLIITHHNSILEYLCPDYVHFLADGSIKKTGNYELAKEIEKNGFANILGQIK